jgi:hypothetical protein
MTLFVYLDRPVTIAGDRNTVTRFRPQDAALFSSICLVISWPFLAKKIEPRYTHRGRDRWLSADTP